MTDTQQQQLEPTGTVPETLDSSGVKLVYLYLRMEERATVDELQRDLDMRKGTLYSLLRTLTERGLVERTGTTYVCQHRTGGTA